MLLGAPVENPALLLPSAWPRRILMAVMAYRAFHDREEIGPRMLVRIAKRTGLRPYVLPS